MLVNKINVHYTRLPLKCAYSAHSSFSRRRLSQKRGPFRMRALSTIWTAFLGRLELSHPQKVDKITLSAISFPGFTLKRRFSSQINRFLALFVNTE